MRHYPFGGQRWSSGGDLSDYDFTGQRLDGFGLLDYNARYYDSVIGRFISADTIVPDFANPQDLNRYSYVRNSPLNFVDPSGHCGEVYSGNPDINASINQDCYALAEEFSSYAGFDVDYLNQYNIDVLRAVQSAWLDNRAGFEVTPGEGLIEDLLTGIGPTLNLPPPEELPVGRPFQLTMTWTGVPDKPQLWLDSIGLVADVGSAASVAGVYSAGLAAYLQGVSFGADALSLSYQGWVNGPEAGVNQAEAIARKHASIFLAEHGSSLFKKLQVGGLVPFVGLYFDVISIRVQTSQAWSIGASPIAE